MVRNAQEIHSRTVCTGGRDHFFAEFQAEYRHSAVSNAEFCAGCRVLYFMSSQTKCRVQYRVKSIGYHTLLYMLHFLGGQTILCTCRVWCRVQFDYTKSAAYRDVLLNYICCTFWVVKLYSASAECRVQFDDPKCAAYIIE